MTLIYLYLEWTSLHIAAWEGYIDMIKILLDHGANVNTKNNDGKRDNNTYTYIHIHIIHIIKL